MSGFVRFGREEAGERSRQLLTDVVTTARLLELVGVDVESHRRPGMSKLARGSYGINALTDEVT